MIFSLTILMKMISKTMRLEMRKNSSFFRKVECFQFNSRLKCLHSTFTYLKLILVQCLIGFCEVKGYEHWGEERKRNMLILNLSAFHFPRFWVLSIFPFIMCVFISPKYEEIWILLKMPVMYISEKSILPIEQSAKNFFIQ